MISPVESLPNAVAVVMAADGPRGRLWAISSVIEIGRALGSDRRVVLVDLQRNTPSALAAALDVEPAAGMMDVLLRGVSFSSVMCRLRSEVFFFVPFGCERLEPSSVFGHPRWTRVVSRLPNASATLLLCVSADDWLAAGPIRGFEACIVVNGTAGKITLPTGARRIIELRMPLGRRESRSDGIDLPDYAVLEAPSREHVGLGVGLSRVQSRIDDLNQAGVAGPGHATPPARWRGNVERPLDVGGLSGPSNLDANRTTEILPLRLFAPAVGPEPRRTPSSPVVLLPPPYEEEFPRRSGLRTRWRALTLSAAVAAIALAVLGLLV